MKINTVTGASYLNPVFYGEKWVLDCSEVLPLLYVYYRNGEPADESLIKKSNKLMRESGVKLKILGIVERTRTTFPPKYIGLHKSIVLEVEISQVPDGLNLASGFRFSGHSDST